MWFKVVFCKAHLCFMSFGSVLWIAFESSDSRLCSSPPQRVVHMLQVMAWGQHVLLNLQHFFFNIVYILVYIPFFRYFMLTLSDSWNGSSCDISTFLSRINQLFLIHVPKFSQTFRLDGAFEKVLRVGRESTERPNNQPSPPGLTIFNWLIMEMSDRPLSFPFSSSIFFPFLLLFFSFIYSLFFYLFFSFSICLHKYFRFVRLATKIDPRSLLNRFFSALLKPFPFLLWRVKLRLL